MESISEMEYHKRSLWNRVWENDSLDSLSEENYVQDMYEQRRGLPWKAVCYGIVLSMWKGVQWILLRPLNLKREMEEKWRREEEEEDRNN